MAEMQIIAKAAVLRGHTLDGRMVIVECDIEGVTAYVHTISETMYDAELWLTVDNHVLGAARSIRSGNQPTMVAAGSRVTASSVVTIRDVP